eukprot:TRINITY_DN8771_c0_g1_i1.p1 TRINITY_DN8771_c0_g1~~TRINITY_DN8771_c0_g1_i1.p1  ORF type:complete len:180 (-),score=34.99 TRINITY_DN8771_c0_g1_i1:101-640(-)
MDDTQPLFGEESREQKLVINVGTFGTIAWVLYCGIIGVVLGIVKHHIQHLLFGAFIFVLAVLPYFLFRWYRDDESGLDVKFKWLTVWAFVAVWIAGVVLNFYVWTDKPVALPCGGAGSDFFVIYNSTGDPNCYPQCPGGQCFYFPNMTCIDCTNCTLNAIQNYDMDFFFEKLAGSSGSD